MNAQSLNMAGYKKKKELPLPNNEDDMIWREYLVLRGVNKIEKIKRNAAKRESKQFT